MKPALLQREDGGAVVEVALVMPVLLLMVMGAMQFGVVLFGYCSASFATRSAVRYASTHSSSSQAPASSASVQGVVTPWLWMGTQTTSPIITVSWPNGNTIGYTVQVTTQLTYRVTLPFTSMTQMTLATTAVRYIVR